MPRLRRITAKQHQAMADKHKRRKVATRQWIRRKCAACDASERGQCKVCRRRILAARMVYFSFQPELVVGDIVLDRLFWLDRCAEVLRGEVPATKRTVC